MNVTLTGLCVDITEGLGDILERSSSVPRREGRANTEDLCESSVRVCVVEGSISTSLNLLHNNEAGDQSPGTRRVFHKVLNSASCPRFLQAGDTLFQTVLGQAGWVCLVVYGLVQRC
jgi:hypothetical protein